VDRYDGFREFLIASEQSLSRLSAMILVSLRTGVAYGRVDIPADASMPILDGDAVTYTRQANYSSPVDLIRVDPATDKAVRVARLPATAYVCLRGGSNVEPLPNPADQPKD
jgi:hypothetical protein